MYLTCVDNLMYTGAGDTLLALPLPPKKVEPGLGRLALKSLTGMTLTKSSSHGVEHYEATNVRGTAGPPGS